MSACTCNRKFLDAEDFRDHLPCDGTVEQQLRRERDALAARLEEVTPTAEEREALIELADEVRSLFRDQPQAELAVAAIDKLTKEKP